MFNGGYAGGWVPWNDGPVPRSVDFRGELEREIGLLHEASLAGDIERFEKLSRAYESTARRHGLLASRLFEDPDQVGMTTEDLERLHREAYWNCARFAYRQLQQLAQGIRHDPASMLRPLTQVREAAQRYELGMGIEVSPENYRAVLPRRYQTLLLGIATCYDPRSKELSQSKRFFYWRGIDLYGNRDRPFPALSQDPLRSG